MKAWLIFLCGSSDRKRLKTFINSASFAAVLLSWPVPNADVGMHAVLQQHAEGLLKAKVQGGQNIVAQDLNLTQRTLQKKLSEANTIFQRVLDQTRHELAKDYLSQRQLSLADITFLLGYQEQSAFNHVFKGWLGISPGSYRERL